MKLRLRLTYLLSVIASLFSTPFYATCRIAGDIY